MSEWGWHGVGVDVSDPASALLSPGSRAVLRTLAGTTQPLTGRDVARLCGLSQNGAYKILVHLVDHGLVSAEAAGRAVLYVLNRQHLLVEPLLDVLAARERLVHRLAAVMAEWEVPTIHASLYGSAARGDGDVHSDVDVLVVRPDDVDVDSAQWRRQLEQLAVDVHTWTGNWLAWLELSEAELAVSASGGEPIVTEWRRDAEALAGRELDQLLSGAPA